MQDSQTAVSGQRSAVSRRQNSPFPFRLSPSRSAFTLTELLIVIAIIAVLAGLIAAAAVNALNAAKRGQIVLEIKNLSGAIENFKNDYGAYPPNGMINAPSTVSGSPGALVKADFIRMFKKAFPKHNEPQALIEALAGATPTTSGIVTAPLQNGMRASEALYFWMGGFSSDEVYPISGPGGPSFLDTNTAGDEVLENRTKRYEFDLTRLVPRNNNGGFDESGNRFIQYKINMGSGDQNRQINMWQYAPKGSEQPLVYFDVSRHKPGAVSGKYDLWAALPGGDIPHIYALKQLREGVTATGGSLNNIVFVNQGKFQILHAGLDDDWGDESFKEAGTWTVSGGNVDNLLIYPAGPFIGPIADTLTNFSDGTLADASEE